MPFTVNDYHDFVELLDQHPEWRAELRRLLLTDDFLTLPQVVRELAEAQKRTGAHVEELAEAQKRTEARVEELAEAQKRTEARVGELAEAQRALAEAQKRTEERVEELAEAQKRTEARVEELAEAQKRTEARVEELAEAQKRTEARVEELAEAQKRTEARVEELAEAQKRTEARVGELAEAQRALAEAQKRTEERVEELAEAQQRTEETVRQLLLAVGSLKQDVRTLKDGVAELKGESTELRFRQRFFSYLGGWLQKAQVVSIMDLKVDEAYQRGQLSDEEYRELLALDLMVSGRMGKGAETKPVVVALEVSYVIDTNDVERASHRAALLRRLGIDAIAAVGGKQALAEATTRAQQLGVVVTLDGRTL